MCVISVIFNTAVLIDWLIDWLIDLLIDWLIDWLNRRRHFVFKWYFGKLVLNEFVLVKFDLLWCVLFWYYFDHLEYGCIDWLIDWLIYLLIDWLIDWLNRRRHFVFKWYFGKLVLNEFVLVKFDLLWCVLFWYYFDHLEYGCIDWLTDWLIDWFIEWMNEWMIDWFIVAYAMWAIYQL